MPTPFDQKHSHSAPIRRSRAFDANISCTGRFTRLSILLCALCLCIPPSWAQVSADLSGTVTDQSRAAVSGGAVTVRDLDTGLSRSTVTDQAGRYQVSALPVGQYEVRVKKDGFAEGVRTGIRLVVGQDALADLSLRVGVVSEQVKVTGDAAVVNVTTQDVSGLVGEQQVKDLPLNGRSYDLLLTLNPGIVNFTSEKTGGIGVSNSTTGNNFAVSGNRPQQNLFLLNGVEFTGAAENNMQPGGTSGQLLGVDAVREFNLLRDSYGAEYGKRPGGQVIIVTQSGANQVHGSAYEYLRNNALDAPNILTRAPLRLFSVTSLARLSAAPSKRARRSSSAITKDCASTCIRHRQLLFRTLHRAQPPIPASCLCSICGRSRQREPRTSMESPRFSAVPCKPFERILERHAWITSFPSGIHYPASTPSTMAMTSQPPPSTHTAPTS